MIRARALGLGKQRQDIGIEYPAIITAVNADGTLQLHVFATTHHDIKKSGTRR